MDYLLTKLYDNNFFRCINVIFIADHGFASTPCEEKLYLEDYMNLDNVDTYESGPVLRIYASESKSHFNSIQLKLFSGLIAQDTQKAPGQVIA